MFITFEGIEGCGKSTQARLLYEWFLDNGYQTILTREPGGTEAAEEIRQLLLREREETVPPFSELCLYIAARGFHVKNLILPSLRKGIIVICDRFSDSTLAYQGFGRGLPRKLIEEMNKLSTENLKPDLTFLLDISVEEAFKRLKGKIKDRLEKEPVDFHERVRKGFLSIAAQESERVKVIDGKKSIEEVFSEIKKIVIERLRWD